MKCRKRQYKTIGAAYFNILKLIENNKAYEGELKAYKCKKCSTKKYKVFHIGHKIGRLKVKPSTWDKL